MGSVRSSVSSLLRAARKAWRSWAPQEGEPHFWEVFGSVAVIGVAFWAGFLTTPVRIVTAIFLALLGTCAIWRYRVWRYREKHHKLKGFERTSIISVIAVAMMLIIADIAYSVVQGSAPQKLPPLSQGSPASSSRPIFSYYAFPSGEFQDIDVRIANKGYVRQVFTARSDVISSIVVIASRQPSPNSSFSVEDIGSVRLQLEEVDPADPAHVIRYLPVALADSGGPPSPAGAVKEAGPNHENTTFDLDPVQVTKGKLYAFVVTNLCGSWMAFSLHSTGIGNSPLYMYGYNFHPYIDERTNRALTGYVCDITNCS
jgi:hypothetical protein